MSAKIPNQLSSADADPAIEHVILLRVSEIFLKGRNRYRFFDRFAQQARRLLRGIDGVRVEPLYLRIAVWHPPAARNACLMRLQHLFGLSSMLIGRAVAADIDDIIECAISSLAHMPADKTFKVESRRRNKQFPMHSDEISRVVGTAVAERTGRRADMHHPDIPVRVEIGRGDGSEPSFVLSDVMPGPGGLPVGTAGRAVLLLSGGIDSPVAGYAAMRRGCQICAVYFHSFPYTGDKTKEKVLDLARHLAMWQGRMRVHVVHFTEVQKQIRATLKPELAVVGYRRMMMRVASAIGVREECKAIVTGENLGQVASQTMDNLGVIEEAATLPVLRPVIAFDKDEIIERAHRIGTYDTSILPYDDCCSLFVPRHPATRARVIDLQRGEESLDMAALTQALVDGTETIDL